MFVFYDPKHYAISIHISEYEKSTFEELASENKRSVSSFISSSLHDYFDSLTNSIY